MEGVQQKGDANHLEAGVDALEHERNAYSMHLSDCRLQVEQRDAYHKHGNEIGDQKNPTSVLVDQVGESPKGSEANSEPNNTKNILPDIIVNVRVILIVSQLGSLGGLNRKKTALRVSILI